MPSSPAVPAVLDPLADRRRAALHGGLAAGIPTLALAALLPAAHHQFFPMLWHSLSAAVGPALAPYLALLVLFSAPALLVLPAGLLAARVAAGHAKGDPDLGLAAAAGAGIAATGVGAGAVLLRAANAQDLVLAAPLAAAVALGVGVIGALAFAATGRHARRAPLPSLYPTLMAAGFGGPALLAGGGLWAAVVQWLPQLSPHALASFFSGILPAAALEPTTVAIALGGLAPVTYGMSRLARRLFPRTHRGGLAAGLVFPALLPFLGVLAITIDGAAPGGMMASLWMLTGCFAGAGIHAAAAFLGLARGRPLGLLIRREITPGRPATLASRRPEELPA